MNRWTHLTIGDLCENGLAELQTGPFGSQLHAHEYVAEGVPVVPTEAIRDRKIDHSVLPRILEEKANQLSRHRLRAGDILFARRGVQATGHSAFVREHEEGFLCGTGAIRLRLLPQNEKVDATFLSHVFASQASIDWFKFHAIGATMPNLNEGIIRSFRFACPPLTEQRAIASILGALDDKIELNRRMNETLEAMARAIFQDWFVAFGPTRAKMEGRPHYLAPDLWALFPDRLDAEGKPEGWREVPLDQIADFLNGLALQKYPGTGDDDLPVIKIAELRAGSASGSDRASRAIPPQYVVEDGDILFSWSGSLLQRVWTGGRGALNQHLFKVTSREWPKWLHYLWVDHHLPQFQAIAASKATTMGHIQRHHLSEAMTVIGSREIMKAADELIAPLFQRSFANSLESRTLAATRDLLLPRLMSGELRVHDAERLMETAA